MSHNQYPRWVGSAVRDKIIFCLVLRRCISMWANTTDYSSPNEFIVAILSCVRIQMPPKMLTSHPKKLLAPITYICRPHFKVKMIISCPQYLWRLILPPLLLLLQQVECKIIERTQFTFQAAKIGLASKSRPQHRITRHALDGSMSKHFRCCCINYNSP